LNMYGFHKVPQSGSGALLSEFPEIWEFNHSCFQKGRQELLPLVKRKNHKTEEDHHYNNNNNSCGNNVFATESNFKGSDFANVLSELSAIRQAQRTITEELNSVKNANKILWQEQITQRQKHEKQQEVIDKILRFLSSVYNNKDAKNLKEKEQELIHKKPKLLMQSASPNLREASSDPFMFKEDNKIHPEILEIVNKSRGSPPLVGTPDIENLSNNLEMLQENIDSITDSLGLEQNLNSEDIQEFMENYFNLDSN
jgi:hypothetical protein